MGKYIGSKREIRSADDQPTIQWLLVISPWTFLDVSMHFNEKLFMCECDNCNAVVKVYQYQSEHPILVKAHPILVKAHDGKFYKNG